MKRRWVSVALPMVAALLACSSARAETGLDPAFGVGGIATSALPVPAAEAKAGIVDLASAPGGGVYGALKGLGGHAYLGVVRLDEAGAPDPTFGEGGFTAPFLDPYVTSSSNGSGPEAEAIAIGPDGKILVAGASISRAYVKEDGSYLETVTPMLVRYLPDGSLDPSFGKDGSLAIAGAAGPFSDLTVAPSGRIFAIAEGGAFAFEPNGAQVGDFVSQGLGLVGEGGSGPLVSARAIDLLADGKLLVAGYRGSRLLLVRLRPDGRPDRTFGGGDGFVTAGIGGDRCCGPAALSVDADGRPVVVVNSDARAAAVFVARFGPDGGRDRTFGGGDGLLPLPPRFNRAFGVTVGQDGVIYAVGTVGPRSSASHFDYGVARIRLTGTLDSGFGLAGIETLRRGTQSIAGSALTLPDGDVLVGGSYAFKVAARHQTALLFTRYRQAAAPL